VALLEVLLPPHSLSRRACRHLVMVEGMFSRIFARPGALAALLTSPVSVFLRRVPETYRHLSDPEILYLFRR